jgi:thiamine-phosphate pyrophosphorylase
LPGVKAGSRAARIEQLDRARLYVVSDARTDQGDLPEFLDAILEAGVGIIQLREKTAEAADLIRWGEVFRGAADRYGALFIVNDRADVALALDADGVHLGQDDLSPAMARRILGPDVIIGLSCHSTADHAGAGPEPDYLTAGPVFATPTKPGRQATGLDLIVSAAENVERPWFAIGGIDETNVANIVNAGANRIAVVRAVTNADDAGAAVRSLRSAIGRPNAARE